MAVLACSHLYWQPAAETGAGGARESSTNSSAAKPSAARSGTGTTSEEGGEAEDPTEKPEETIPIASDASTGQQAPIRDAAGVLSSLKRALKIAAAVQQQLGIVPRKGESLSTPGRLYLEILNKYMYYFDAGVEIVTPAVLQSMIELVQNEVAGEACVGDEALQTYYKNTIEHLKQKKAAGGNHAKYDELQI